MAEIAPPAPDRPPPRRSAPPPPRSRRRPAPLRPRLRGTLARAWDSDFLWSFRHSPVAIVSSLVALVLILAAVLAPAIAPQNPFDPAQLDLSDGFSARRDAERDHRPRLPPRHGPAGARHGLGDPLRGAGLAPRRLRLGRCSPSWSASRLGLVAGYLGGRTEALIMRVADIQLSFPAILVALLVFGVVPRRRAALAAGGRDARRARRRDRPVELGPVRPHRARHDPGREGARSMSTPPG